MLWLVGAGAGLLLLCACSGSNSSGVEGTPLTAAPVITGPHAPPLLAGDHVVSLSYSPRPEGSIEIASHELGGVNGTSRAVEPVLAALPRVLPANRAQPAQCGDGRRDAWVVVGFDDGTHYDYGPCTWPNELWPAITALTHVSPAVG